jgi:DNA-binding response OmpR family regulator
MAKVLLVEDDNNLREIYEARLQAEGYETVTASDGEQALVIAKDAKPDLVISDVMMPKISGFEMLDILRNTDGLKDVKVIMLTALGQSEDKTRADQLGADKYLVKSQVTLEDIVKTAHQLLDDSVASAPVAAAANSAAPAITPDTAAPALTVETATSTEEESQAMQAQIDSFAAAPAVDPPVADIADSTLAAPALAVDVPATAAATPVVDTPTTVAPTPPTEDTSSHDDQVMATAVDSLTVTPEAQKPSDVTAVEIAPPVTPLPVAEPAGAPEAVTPEVAPAENSRSDSVTIAHKKVIEPLNDPATAKPDINQLLANEQAQTTSNDAVPTAPADTTVTPTPEVGATSAAAAAITEPTADPSAPNPNDIAL